MNRLRAAVIAFVAAGATGAAGYRQVAAPLASHPDAEGDVVVTGRVPRCHPRPGDPQDAVDLTSARSGPRRQQVIATDPSTGRYALMPDEYPITGPAVWQRAGVGLDDFVFRVPAGRDPLCIGARKAHVDGEAQVRRAFDARPYWGKYLILSATVAARKAGRVDMWIAAGASDPRPHTDRDVARDVVAGGFKHVPITGDYNWRQVNFLVAPIPCMASAISYGVQLRGGGDVWLARPQFVEVPEDRLSPSMKRLPHGAAMLRNDPICRFRRNEEQLFTRHFDIFIPLGKGADLYPGLALHRQLDDGQYEPLPYSRSFAPGLTEF